MKTIHYFLHQLVINHSVFGKGQLSVNHISQNKIENNNTITTKYKSGKSISSF